MALTNRDKQELAELRSRGSGISAREWQRFSRTQQTEILRQSRKISREASQTPEQRRRNARRRASRYAAEDRLARLDDWPEEETAEFWDRYREQMGYFVQARAA